MIGRISDRAEFPAEWTTRREDVVMSNPRIGMIQHVITCDGQGTPKYDQPLLVTNGGVICIACDFTGKMVLLKRYREVCVAAGLPRVIPIEDGATCGATSYEFPRGGIEKNETGEAAALREAEEEIGLAATKATWLDRLNSDTAFFPYSEQVFLVEVDRDRPSTMPPDPNEEIEVLFVTLQELLSRVRAGEIFCGQTKAALATYMAYLHANGTLFSMLGKSG